MSWILIDAITTLPSNPQKAAATPHDSPPTRSSHNTTQALKHVKRLNSHRQLSLSPQVKKKSKKSRSRIQQNYYELRSPN